MVPDLRALEEDCDLGVGRVREHVEDAALDGAQRGHGRQVRSQRCGVARGVDDAGRVALVQVGGQLCPDASTRRVDDDHVGHVLGRLGSSPRGRVVRDEGRSRSWQARVACGADRRGDRPGGYLDAGDARESGACGSEGEAADTAVQVPQAFGQPSVGEGARRPHRGLLVQGRGDGRVRLREGARPQFEAFHGQWEGAGVRQDDLIGALHDGLVRGVNVRGDDVCAGHEVAQERQRGADVGDAVARAQDEADHEPLAVAHGDEDVLELPALGGNVVGRQVQGSDEALEAGRCAVDGGVLDGAAGQVDAAAVGSQDAQGGAASSSADDELCARAKSLLRGRGWGQPGDLAGSWDGGEGGCDGLDLAGELTLVGQGEEGAGPAGPGVKVVAVHPLSVSGGGAYRQVRPAPVCGG